MTPRDADRMTVDQAAAYLGLASYTVRALCRSRELPHYRVGPRKGRILIGRQDCDQYLARSRVDRDVAKAATPSPPPAPSRGDYQFQFFEPGTLKRLKRPAAR